jgi:hypothetical protein
MCLSIWILLQKKAFANFHYALKKMDFFFSVNRNRRLHPQFITQVEEMKKKIYSRKLRSVHTCYHRTRRVDDNKRQTRYTKMEVKQTDFRKVQRQ